MDPMVNRRKWKFSATSSSNDYLLCFRTYRTFLSFLFIEFVNKLSPFHVGQLVLGECSENLERRVFEVDVNVFVLVFSVACFNSGEREREREKFGWCLLRFAIR